MTDENEIYEPVDKYVGEETVIVYDTEGNQHVYIKDEDNDKSKVSND